MRRGIRLPVGGAGVLLARVAACPAPLAADKEKPMPRVLGMIALATGLVLFTGCGRSTESPPNAGGDAKPGTDGKPGDGGKPAAKVVAPRLNFDGGGMVRIPAVGVTPDGAYIVALAAGTGGNLDHKTQVWDVAAKNKVKALNNPDAFISPLAVAPDGKSYACYTSTGVGLSSLPDCKPLRTLSRKDGQVLGFLQALAFSPKGDLLIAAAKKELVGFDPKSGEQRFVWPADAEEVTSLSAFFDGGDRIASGGAKGEIKVWEVAGGTSKTLTGEIKGKVVGLAVSPDGKRLAAVPETGRIQVFDLASGQAKTLEAAGTRVAALFLPDNVTLVHGTGDLKDVGPEKNEFVLENVTTGARTHALRGHTKHCYGVALTADGGTLVTGSDDGTIKVWDLKNLP
jgi:WD40 repeat protein